MEDVFSEYERNPSQVEAEANVSETRLLNQ